MVPRGDGAFAGGGIKLLSGSVFIVLKFMIMSQSGVAGWTAVLPLPPRSKITKAVSRAGPVSRACHRGPKPDSDPVISLLPGIP